MRSTMQDYQLTIGSIRQHGTTVHRDSEVVTATPDGSRIHVVRRARRAGRTPGERAALPRHRRRPAGGDVPVEQRRAPRGLPRRPVHGRRAPHAQHPAVPRAARLHRQPRRGPGRHRRRLAGAAAGQAAAGKLETVKHVLVAGPDAASADLDSLRASRQGGPALRRPAGRAARGVRLARGGRARRRRDVLHERHDRQPEGRGLQPPVGVAALAGGVHRQRRAASTSTTGSCRSCRCSTPTPGAWPTPR